MIAQNLDATAIRADELTEGDIIQHCGDTWMIVTEPEYTTAGITFNVLCLDVEASNNTQTVCKAPQESFVLLDHQGTESGGHRIGTPMSVNSLQSVYAS